KELLESDAGTAARLHPRPVREEDPGGPMAARLIGRLDGTKPLAPHGGDETPRDVDVRIRHLEEQLRRLVAIAPRPELVPFPDPADGRAAQHGIVHAHEALAYRGDRGGPLAARETA